MDIYLVGGGKDPRRYYTDHADVHFYRRARECHSCRERFPTAEIPEELLDELVELRDGLVRMLDAVDAVESDSQVVMTEIASLVDALRAIRDLRSRPAGAG